MVVQIRARLRWIVNWLPSRLIWTVHGRYTDRRLLITLHICIYYLVEIERWVNFDVVTDPDYLQQMKYAFVMEKMPFLEKIKKGVRQRWYSHHVSICGSWASHPTQDQENVCKGVKEAHDMQLTNSPADIVDRQVIEHNAWLMAARNLPASPRQATHIITRKPDGTIGPISQDIVMRIHWTNWSVSWVFVRTMQIPHLSTSVCNIEVKGLNKQHQLKKNIRIKTSSQAHSFKDSELKTVRYR